MSASAVVSAVLALVAAALFAVSLAFQQRGNLQALRGEGRVRNQVLATVLQPWWFGGIALSLVGFVIYAVALNLGSLTVAQPLQVTQLIFTVPLGAWVAGTAPLALVAAAAAMGLCLVGVSMLARSPSLLALTADSAGDGEPLAVGDDQRDDAAGYDQPSRS